MPDVRAIRERLKMTQNEFARAYRIPLATLKGWEQGRRRPDAPATACLQVIARKPKAARDALALNQERVLRNNAVRRPIGGESCRHT